MLFNSQVFVLGFLPVCLAGFFAFGRLGAAWALRWLLAASLVFYGWWNAPLVGLLAGSIAVNYALGSLILRHADRAAARRLTVLGVALNLALLGWFKYADFLVQSFAGALGLETPLLRIGLPLAISFFTFQQIMFLVDSYTRSRPPVRALPYAAFVSFFPHLIAGPLVRPREIIPQLLNPALARPDAENLTVGLTVFLLGLGKKLVLADTFAPFADRGFAAAAQGTPLTFFEAWCAALAYALQIYFDFSGYSDMAIGLARMMNIRFPQNFDSPYKSRNISEFWHRWHITLSHFLRDYVYIPLGGNRCGQVRRGVNLMATMLLGGLWHGAAWNFVLWGGLHGGFLIAHQQFRRLAPRGMPALAGQALTLLAVVAAWVPFRADGTGASLAMLRGMAGLNGAALPQMIVNLFPPLGIFATPVPVLLALGDGRTLSFPEVTACLALGWLIVLAAPNVAALTERQRLGALVGGFALTAQALFFAPSAAPFLYFRF